MSQPQSFLSWQEWGQRPELVNSTSGLMCGGRISCSHLCPCTWKAKGLDLHIGSCMLAGLGKDVTTRPPDSLDIAIPFHCGAVVDAVLCEDHEHCLFQNCHCHCTSGCDILNCGWSLGSYWLLPIFLSI